MNGFQAGVRFARERNNNITSEERMKRTNLKCVVSTLAVIAVFGSDYAQAQTPGHIPVFDQPGTGACNNANGNDCIDSVITQDPTGNIGIGTTAPVARLHVAGGNLFLESSTPTSGNILKGGSVFIHDTGPANTFMGPGAGNFSVSGDTNTGIGFSALASLAGGFSNTAVGGLALFTNSSGHTNTAVGRGALQSNSVGFENTATGRSALISNDSGNLNTADGVNALQTNFNGSRNVAMGESALFGNVSGSTNVAVGNEALKQAGGDGNIAVGDSSGIHLLNGNSNIYVGYPGAADFSESNTIRVGNCFGGIFGCAHQRFFAAGVVNSAVNGVPVLVDGNGQLGVAPSSRRFKEDIHDMGDASAKLRNLRPVTFYYTSAVQPGGERQLQYGLIAEEVAAVYPELVEYSNSGEPFSVRYQLLGTMLLNELQREDRQLDQQQQQILAQAAQIAHLQAQLAAITHRLSEGDAAPKR